MAAAAKPGPGEEVLCIGHAQCGKLLAADVYRNGLLLLAATTRIHGRHGRRAAGRFGRENWWIRMSAFPHNRPPAADNQPKDQPRTRLQRSQPRPRPTPPSLISI